MLNPMMTTKGRLKAREWLVHGGGTVDVHRSRIEINSIDVVDICARLSGRRARRLINHTHTHGLCPPDWRGPPPSKSHAGPSATDAVDGLRQAWQWRCWRRCRRMHRVRLLHARRRRPTSPRSPSSADACAGAQKLAVGILASAHRRCFTLAAIVMVVPKRSAWPLNARRKPEGVYEHMCTRRWLLAL